MGLGIRQVGQHIAKVLAREFGSLGEIMSADRERFQQIREIGPEISEGLVLYWSEPRNREVIAQLQESGVQVAPGMATGDRKQSRSQGRRSYLPVGWITSREMARNRLWKRQERVCPQA